MLFVLWQEEDKCGVQPEEKHCEEEHQDQWTRCTINRSVEMGKWTSREQGETDTPQRLWEEAGLSHSVWQARVRLFRVKKQKFRGFGNSQATQIWLVQKTGVYI